MIVLFVEFQMKFQFTKLFGLYGFQQKEHKNRVMGDVPTVHTSCGL